MGDLSNTTQGELMAILSGANHVGNASRESTDDESICSAFQERRDLLGTERVADEPGDRKALLHEEEEEAEEGGRECLHASHIL